MRLGIGHYFHHRLVGGFQRTKSLDHRKKIKDDRFLELIGKDNYVWRFPNLKKRVMRLLRT